MKDSTLPSGRENVVTMLSQGCATLHSGLFSGLPSGKTAVTRLSRHRYRAVRQGYSAVSTGGQCRLCAKRYSYDCPAPGFAFAAAFSCNRVS